MSNDDLIRDLRTAQAHLTTDGHGEVADRLHAVSAALEAQSAPLDRDALIEALTGFDIHMQAGVPSHVVLHSYEARQVADVVVRVVDRSGFVRELTNQDSHWGFTVEGATDLYDALIEAGVIR